MRKGLPTRIISVGVIFISLAWIAAGHRFGCSPEFEAHPHQAVGMVMARQALKLHKSGGKIVVIKRDTAAFSNSAADAQFEAFSRVLRDSKVSIDSVQLIQVDSLAPLAVPPGDFAETIRRSGDNDVIVSFMGPPVLSPAQRALLPEKGGGQVVAFCPGNLPERIDLPGLIRDGMVQVAVVSRRPASAGANHPGNLQAWFDLMFQEVTSANVSAVFPATTR